MASKILFLLQLVVIINCELIREQFESYNNSRHHNFNITTDVKPIQYDIGIRLDPDFDFKYYNGTTRIRFVSQVNTNHLLFHFNKTIHNDVHLIQLKSTNQTREPYEFNVTFYTGFLNEFVLLETNNVNFLEKGKVYDLYMEFTTRFVEGSVEGFYKTCTNLSDGTKNCFTATHMEIHNIRNTLPSFDYVGFKVNFNLNITHHKDLLALSNMPITITKCEGNMVTTTFEQTPKMSTYILAFAVGKFDRISIENESNIKMNLYTPIESNLGAFIAQKYTGMLLSALENYVNTTYTLSKLDFLATSSHSTLGMENWGLVIYNYKEMFDHSNPPSTKNIEKSLAIVAHELAHQFFGNLVTMKERKHFWLNEGFATYFTHRILDIVFPEERYLERIILSNIRNTFRLESSLDSTILDNFQVNMTLIQTTVSYHKGSAIIHMLNHIMGEKSFQQMIRNYIDRYAYDSVTPDDLIAEIELVNSIDKTIPSDIDIKEFMYSWIQQDKLPLVTVKRNYETGEVEISQQPYYVNSNDANDTWWIPYNYATKSNSSFNSTFPDGWLRNEPSIKLPINLPADDWLVLNRQSTGYYLVNYDETNWNLIADLFGSDQYETIPAIDRAKLLSDAFLLMDENQTVSPEIMSNLLRVLKYDRSYLTWRVAHNYFNSYNRYKNEKLFKQNNGSELVINLLNDLGIDVQPGETRETQLTRYYLIDWVCDIAKDKCRSIFSKQTIEFLRAIDNNETYTVAPDLLKLFFCNGFNDSDDFIKVLTYIQAIDDKHLKRAIYSSFDCHSNLTVFRKYYVPIVFGLKLPKTMIADHALLAEGLKYREFVNDIDVFNKCLVENCYDFEANYPDENERRDAVSSILENIVQTMKIKFDLQPSITIHGLLDAVDKDFGGDISTKIRDKFDLSKRYLNYG